MPVQLCGTAVASFWTRLRLLQHSAWGVLQYGNYMEVFDRVRGMYTRAYRCFGVTQTFESLEYNSSHVKELVLESPSDDTDASLALPDAVGRLLKATPTIDGIELTRINCNKDTSLSSDSSRFDQSTANRRGICASLQEHPSLQVQPRSLCIWTHTSPRRSLPLSPIEFIAAIF